MTASVPSWVAVPSAPVSFESMTFPCASFQTMRTPALGPVSEWTVTLTAGVGGSASGLASGAEPSIGLAGGMFASMSPTSKGGPLDDSSSQAIMADSKKRGMKATASLRMSE